MPYIYKITNLINGKMYIGKTLDTIEKRWKDHKSDSFRKKVAKIDLNTNEILEVYISIREAEKVNGQTRHIGDVCNGKRKSCKGFGWKFLED